jgi:hypothetical protein
MITVTATDLLKTIDATLVQYVAPSLGDIGGRSALATVRHLLNFVQVRIEREGQVLLDDIAALKLTLAEVLAYHRAAGDDASATEKALTAAPAPDATKYRSLNDLSAEAGALREALYQALTRLQALRATRGQDPQYKALRATIRAYIVRQIEQEGEIVAPAFFGRGPRR